MTEPPSDTPTAGRLFILAAAVLWSTSGVITKGIDLDPLSIAFYRSLFAGLSLLPFIPRGRWVIKPAIIPLGLLFGIMTGTYITSIKMTTAANAIFLQCTSVFWTVPLSAIVLKELPDRRALVAIGLAMFGCALIVIYGRDGRPNEELGLALGLCSGVLYAIVTVGFRKFRALDSGWLSAFNNLAGSVAIGLWVVSSRGSMPLPSSGQALVLFGFGVFQMAIPYILFARGLRTINAPEAGLLGLLEPVLNPIWVVMAHGERPADLTIVGGLFLLAGVACRYLPVR